jgi:DNA-binding transcriptional ArsR family regulator
MFDPERVVVMELLGRRHGRDREELYASLEMLSRAEVDAAITSLEKHGVVTTASTGVIPTPALRHIEHLNLIAV